MLLKKSDLRTTLRAMRQRVLPEDRAQAAEQAAVQLCASSIYQQSQRIACYLAFDQEFDCSAIIEKIWQANKQCYLPILTEDKSLEFAQFHADTELHSNRYHIPEPIHSPKIDLMELDLILMPLLGFDLQGNRLGMGGGYYDRTLQKRIGKGPKPYLIGMAYAFQQVPEIPHDKWDVRLEGVLTEEVFLFPLSL